MARYRNSDRLSVGTQVICSGMPGVITEDIGGGDYIVKLQDGSRVAKNVAKMSPNPAFVEPRVRQGVVTADRSPVEAVRKGGKHEAPGVASDFTEPESQTEPEVESEGSDD